MPTVSEENSYKTILKRLSAFGGVQIISILTNLIRGKFSALLLGPAGIGMSSLFNSAATTFQQFAGLGLNLSLVKDIAASRNDAQHHDAVLSVAVRLIFGTSLLGAILCLILSPLLSEWTFGSRDYTFGFILLSAGVGFSIAGLGFLAILQGRNEVKRLIYSSLVGSLTGLFIGVPLYYFFGLRGIVPAIISIHITTFIFYYYNFKRAVKYNDLTFDRKQHISIAKNLISLGIVFMVGQIASTLTVYLMNMYVRYVGSIEDVGIYQAATSLTSQYVGVLLAAIAMDYYPRLSAASSDCAAMKEIANRQTEVVMLVACPLTLCLIVATPIGVNLLLSKEFYPSIPLIRMLALCVFEQALMFPLGYYFLAKDNKKLYILLEVVITNISWIILCMVLFPIYGITGLGIGQLIRCAIDLILNIYFCRRYYSFAYSLRTLKIITICLVLGIVGFGLAMFDSSLPAVIGAWLTIAISSAYSLLMLRKSVKSES